APAQLASFGASALRTSRSSAYTHIRYPLVVGVAPRSSATSGEALTHFHSSRSRASRRTFRSRSDAVPGPVAWHPATGAGAQVSRASSPPGSVVLVVVDGVVVVVVVDDVVVLGAVVVVLDDVVVVVECVVLVVDDVVVVVDEVVVVGSNVVVVLVDVVLVVGSVVLVVVLGGVVVVVGGGTVVVVVPHAGITEWTHWPPPSHASLVHASPSSGGGAPGGVAQLRLPSSHVSAQAAPPAQGLPPDTQEPALQLSTP